MTLRAKFPDNAMAFRITADSGRVYQYNAPRYSGYQINFKEFRTKAEALSGKTFTDSTIFIIHYIFKDDTCSHWNSNKVGKDLINKRKEYSDKQKKSVEKNTGMQFHWYCLKKGLRY